MERRLSELRERICLGTTSTLVLETAEERVAVDQRRERPTDRAEQDRRCKTHHAPIPPHLFSSALTTHPPLHPLIPMQLPQPPPPSENEIRLRNRHPDRGLGLTKHAISLDDISLRIDAHARHAIVEFHVLFSDLPTVLDGFDPVSEVVACYCS